MRWLEDAVRSAVQDRRVGTPVFLRCTVTLGPPAPELPGTLRALIDAASRLLRAPVVTLYAPATDGGHLTASVACAGGQSAVLAVAAAAPGGQQRSCVWDFLLVGSQGTMAGEHLDDVVEPPAATSGSAAVAAALDTSLRSGRPATVVV